MELDFCWLASVVRKSQLRDAAALNPLGVKHGVCSGVHRDGRPHVSPPFSAEFGDDCGADPNLSCLSRCLWEAAEPCASLPGAQYPFQPAGQPCGQCPTEAPFLMATSAGSSFHRGLDVLCWAGGRGFRSGHGDKLQLLSPLCVSWDLSGQGSVLCLPPATWKLAHSMSPWVHCQL